MPLGLYISVPFCRTKCSYCNFASDVFSKSAYETYVARLLEDIADSRQFASKLGCELDECVDSVYLGGGTPSILEASQLLRIFAAAQTHFTITPDAEITVECAPGTLTPALIETLLQCGVNRVSLGVQSFVDQEAQSVGRLHKRVTVLEEIGRLRQSGIANINIDLIAGLPHQTAESWAYSVAETIAAGVPHASVYMLEVDDDSRLGRELIRGGPRYHAQYEISNFARVQGFENNQSRHNLKYWMRQPYIGFGVDAHSMLAVEHLADTGKDDRWQQGVRLAVTDSLDAYMNRAPHSVTPVSVQAAIEENFFLGLRLNRGIEIEGLRQELDSEMAGVCESVIRECVREGLLEEQGTTVRLTARGRLLSNEVFGRFLVGESEETKWEPVT
jgi:oxygen-independent coproporphyrinogen-3 oxidase